MLPLPSLSPSSAFPVAQEKRLSPLGASSSVWLTSLFPPPGEGVQDGYRIYRSGLEGMKPLTFSVQHSTHFAGARASTLSSTRTAQSSAPAKHPCILRCSSLGFWLCFLYSILLPQGIRIVLGTLEEKIGQSRAVGGEDIILRYRRWQMTLKTPCDFASGSCPSMPPHAVSLRMSSSFS